MKTRLVRLCDLVSMIAGLLVVRSLCLMANCAIKVKDGFFPISLNTLEIQQQLQNIQYNTNI